MAVMLDDAMPLLTLMGLMTRTSGSFLRGGLCGCLAPLSRTLLYVLTGKRKKEQNKEKIKLVK